MPKIFVIARNSVFTYKGKSVKVKQVSEELGVRYVLEGSVRKAGDQIRITAQLIDGLAGHHIWAERYERNLKEIFAVQDDITKNIITALQVKLTEGEQIRAAAKGTNNLEAYLKNLQAMEMMRQFNRESNAGSGRDGYNMYLNGGSGTLYLVTERFFSGSSNANTRVYSESDLLNKWSHIVVTYDGTNLTMYRNGSLASPSTSTGNITNTS